MAAALAALLALQTASLAAASPPPERRAATLGVAVGGYDVVAYRRLDPGNHSDPEHYRPAENATLGSPDHSVAVTMKDTPGTGNSWTYHLHFASSKNMQTFMGSPARYLPKWGGFCAYGIAFENATTENGPWPWARDYLGPPVSQSIKTAAASPCLCLSLCVCVCAVSQRRARYSRGDRSSYPT